MNTRHLGNILFLPVNTFSHIVSSFYLAEFYKVNNNRVYYGCHETHKKTVTDNSFFHYSINELPFGYNLDRVYFKKVVKSKTPYLDLVISRFQNELLKKRKKNVEEVLKSIKPKVIAIDSFTCSDFYFVYDYARANNVVVYLYQTSLSTLKNIKTIPSKYRFPPNIFKVFNYYIWCYHLIHRSLKNAIEFLIYFGRNDSNMLKKIHRTLNNSLYSPDRKTSFSFSIKNLPEIILSPIELEDFSVMSSPDQVYIGLAINIKRVENTVTFNNIFSKLKNYKLKHNNNGKVIICSFGSVVDWVNYKHFIINLINVARKENYFLIVRGDVSLQLPIDINTNIIIAKNLPQQRLLKHVDLLVTHGGLTSIKEAIYFKIPMLLVARNSVFDRSRNIRKAMELKLGMAVRWNATEHNISQCVSGLLYNDEYKNTISDFGEFLTNKYTQKYVYDVLSAISHKNLK